VYRRQAFEYAQNFPLAGAGRLSIATETRAICGEMTCGEAGIHVAHYSHLMVQNPFTLHQVLQRQGYALHAMLGSSHRHMREQGLYGQVDDYYDGSMDVGWQDADDGALLQHTRALAAFCGRSAMLHYHLMAAHTLGKHDVEYQRFGPFKRYAGRTSGSAVPKFSNYYDGGVLQADAEIAEIAEIVRSLAAKAYLRMPWSS
jgi:hypothetical protein